MPIALRDVVALTKPRLSLQVLVTTGGGMFLAPGHIEPANALLTLLTTLMIVGAANALNSYLERDLDRHMQRTRNRPLPAGRLEPWVAIAFALVLIAIAIPVLTVAANSLTALLGLIALISYVMIYTPLKPKSSLALWIGAVPGAIPPLMGWTAVRNAIELPGVLLFAILFCWQIPHFIAIAFFRKDEYARAGHRVLTLRTSAFAAKLHSALWTGLLVASTLALPASGVTGRGYACAAAVLGAVFFGWSLAGFAPRVDDRRWSKSFFLVSLLYLTALFVAIGVGA